MLSEKITLSVIGLGGERDKRRGVPAGTLAARGNGRFYETRRRAQPAANFQHGNHEGGAVEPGGGAVRAGARRRRRR